MGSTSCAGRTACYSAAPTEKLAAQSQSERFSARVEIMRLSLGSEDETPRSLTVTAEWARRTSWTSALDLSNSVLTRSGAERAESRRDATALSRSENRPGKA